MSEPTKLGFLSLEFIVGEDTYWLTTGLGREGFYFTQLPAALFGRAMLNPQFVSREKDYSEIMVMSDGAIFKESQESDGSLFLTDLTTASRLSWNELAARLIDTIPLKDQCGLWHNHIVRKIDPADYVKDVAYKVTAFLPPPEHEGVFAIFGEDYKLPENPNWITCNLPDEAAFRARLRQFKIVAVGINGNYWPAEEPS